jgi:hypothetical protein
VYGQGMSTKPWPNPPLPNNPPERPLRDTGRKGETGVDIYGWGSPIPDETVCKHGEGSCGVCGTTNRRDTVHSTKGGRGVVGRIRR